MKNLIFVESIEARLARYIELSNQIKELEASKDELRRHLEPLVIAAPGQVIKAGNMVLSAAEVSRENFSIKDARANLTPAILTKIQPFISETKYVRLTAKVSK